MWAEVWRAWMGTQKRQVNESGNTNASARVADTRIKSRLVGDLASLAERIPVSFLQQSFRRVGTAVGSQRVRVL